MLENAEHKNWITRFNAFEKISELISELNKEEVNVSSKMFDKMAKCHIQHLNDSHFKV